MSGRNHPASRSPVIAPSATNEIWINRFHRQGNHKMKRNARSDATDASVDPWVYGLDDLFASFWLEKCNNLWTFRVDWLRIGRWWHGPVSMTTTVAHHVKRFDVSQSTGGDRSTGLRWRRIDVVAQDQTDGPRTRWCQYNKASCNNNKGRIDALSDGLARAVFGVEGQERQQQLHLKPLPPAEVFACNQRESRTCSFHHLIHLVLAD